MPSRGVLLDRHLSALERLENAAARRNAAAYRRARQEIIDRLITQWPGNVITPEQATATLRQLGLLGQIDVRLRQLEGELGIILRDTVNSSSEMAIEQMRRELALLPADIRPTAPLFASINHQMIEKFLPVSVQDAALATRSLSLQLQRELQTGLLQGESFPSLVRRTMAATPTGEGLAVWRNGELSAERMVRRTVIASENGAKIASLAETKRMIPEIRKQWVSTLGKDTTDCCLRAHGQIVQVDEQFTLTGTPRFADQLLGPPAHWYCRSSVTMWHASFEDSGLSTADMRSGARAELQRRENEKSTQRRTA